MDTKSRSHTPNLKPLWTDQYGLGDYRKAAFRAHRSPAVSPSPMSPKASPDPMYPSTPVYKSSMIKQERGVMDRLDARSISGDQPSSRSLSPIAEQAVMSRFERVSVNSPGIPRTPVAPPPTPAYPVDPSRPTIAAETRSMLLSGVPEKQANSLGATVDRRQSAPAEAIAGHRHATQLLFREQLQAWGHVHFGNAMNADVFVAAVAVRRGSDSSVSGEEEEQTSTGQVNIRARVRPRALERKPFIISRSFDLEELRAMVPEPQPQSPEGRRSSVDLTARPPATSPHQRSPSASARYKLRSSDRTLRSAAHQGAGRSLVTGTKEIPIHLPYARSYLPVLAALMLSGHIHGKDIIDLPMPHPEAWLKTVAYVYTGQGELTEAMKQNILHLGGKI